MILDLEVLLRIPEVDIHGGYHISPDGRYLAFSWNKSGLWEIYELDLTTLSQAETRIVQRSSGPGGKFVPRYSPDGRCLVWALDLDGSERFHLILFERETGQQRNLTPDAPFTIQPSYSWSPDNRRLAYLCDAHDNFDLYILDMHEPQPSDKPFFETGGSAHFVRWSPDGRHIAVVAEKEWQTDGTFIVPLDGGPARRIGGAEALDAAQPDWSPDGHSVVFSSQSGEWAQIGIYRLSDEHIEWLTADQGNKINPVWSPDGRRLAWVNNHRESAWVEIRSSDGSRLRVEPEAGFAHRPRFTPDGRALLFIHESPQHPAGLWMFSLDDHRLTRLTDSLPLEWRSVQFVQPQAISYPSMDGTLVPAVLYAPPGAGPNSPAVVVIHGGPAWHIGLYWSPLIAHMTSRGWTVIAPNYRGSTGYGQAWMKANRYEMGRLDTDDCAAAALYLVRQGLAHPKKIGVTGRSHGGYLTMSCLTRYPDLWAAGSAVVPFLNWFTGHENVRPDLQYWDILNMGDPVTHRDLWYERSPFFFLDRVKAPVQFICGENDTRCPPEESLEADRKLQALGIPSELHLYPGEGHGFLKLENVIDSEKKCVAFLARFLEA